MRFTVIRLAKKIHQWIFFVALFALVAFVISAFCHPLMVWTGPQSTHFMPPKMAVDAAAIQQVGVALKRNGIENALVSQLVPTEQGVMLQVTERDNAPRRYFTLADALEVDGFDEQQSVWLARYYTGSEAPVKTIEFIDQFSFAYPSVNRLLPVYKVAFATDDNLTAFIYTETNALAALSNDWKRLLKTVFQSFHTWAWLDNYPRLRILLVSALLFSLVSVLFSGLLMLTLIKRKNSRNKKQYWHRKIGWLVVLPFLGFLVSGIYHLYQSEYGPDVKGVRLGQSIDLRPFHEVEGRHFYTLREKTLNTLNLISYQGDPYFRASLAETPISMATGEARIQRFKGVSKEKAGMYFSLQGDQQSFVDRDVAQALAANYIALDDDKLNSVKRVSRFGQGYDFRNKRLPVWAFIYDSQSVDRLYIDPRTGILVDHSIKSQYVEGFSFSWLHKWNFLKGTLGRVGRDVMVVLMLIFIGTLGLMGYRLRRGT